MDARIPAAALAAALALLAGCASGSDEGEVRTVRETVTVTRATPARPVPPGSDDGIPDPVPSGPGSDDGVPDDTGTEAGPVPSPLAPGGVRAGVRALAARLGYTPRFLAIGVYPTYIIFRVQDRAKPRNVDAYDWRDGEISDPDPVRIRGDEVAPRLFSLRDVDIDAVPRLVARAERIPIEEPRVGGVLIERGLPFSPDVRFLVNVSGPRESAQLRADARGRVTDILT